jgi:hypothetical protein
MRLPLFPSFFSTLLVGAAIGVAADDWFWGVAAGLVFVSAIMVVEWCVDAIVREIRKLRLR